ncbi:hypothetical protein HBI67_123820 [Parastagonospora nodorum]|nr:hypothetical protein HBI12_017430 [Parastagonospora nodorum]KAH6059851.1 hypothetical protein HBI66_203110 [Parastagonospora nodorum]KAH6065107.1 hypothetical protein HBI67_123820 [Parastagonospora nodorum]
MSDERTPLIQHVDVRPHRDRYPHHRLRFICTSILSTLVFGGGLAAVILFSLGSFDDHRESAPVSKQSLFSASQIPEGWMHKTTAGYEELQSILLNTPDAEQARVWSRYYTSGPHLAGKNLSQALWTMQRWQEFGIASSIVDYDVYINYPKSHRLALLEKDGDEDEARDSHASTEGEWKVTYEARLEENVLEEDKSSQLVDRIPTFHGYSASGNVTAQYVFVNYGTFQDFEDLLAADVSLDGKIALARYGGVFRGLKVKRAQELGMIGCVIYTDPGDDGEVTEEKGIAPYPEGPAREPSSVQRGSVQFLSFAPGDPTTPGYPSKPGAPRQPTNNAIPQIPSIPISYEDALPILKALNGHGPKATLFGKSWQTGGLGYKGVKYNIGPSPENLVLNLVNEQEYTTTPLWNVIGVINGTLADEVVILGNHRDAWIAGGAGDPNSGSAAFNEVIRSFGLALQTGWKPLRTIVFASWDGEEYGLIGSTEWVEEYLPWLSGSTVAYLNVDVATDGPDFKLAAAPLLNQVVQETLKLVTSPNTTVQGQSVYEAWDKVIDTMGSGSDFTAFQDFAGIPSMDMGFGFDSKSAVYHYHSNYDSMDWMERFGDPSFQYHATIAKLWGLVAARLIETPVLQLNATEYSIGLDRYVDSVKQKAKEAEYGDKEDDAFEAMDNALVHFRFAAAIQDATAAQLLLDYYNNDIPWWKPWEKVKLYLAIRTINTKYKLLERKFLYPEGLDGRPWFKHVVFAPGKWTGYAGATFPGIVEGIDEKDDATVKKWIDIASKAIDAAADWLEE